MSNVQLYSQVAAEVAPSLRSIVPEPVEELTPEAADDEFATDALDAAASGRSAASSMPIMPYRLRVTGSRAETFSGRHVAMATGWNNSVARWYEINLYETESGQVVCDIRLFHKDEGEHDLYRVQTLSDWTATISYLETYNPAHDLPCNVAVEDHAMSAAEVSLQGIALRQQLLELQTQYQTLVGNLLYELKVGSEL